MTFSKHFAETAKERQSRLILALDEPDFKKAFTVLRRVAPHFAAVKIHPEHALLWGKPHAKVVEKIKSLQIPFVILDAKLADIPESNAFKAKYYFEQGYDALICHGFAGAQSVQAIVDAAEGKGVFLLAAMTPPGHLFSPEVVTQLCQTAQSVSVSGVVAPGNQYEILSGIRQKIGPDKIILSPGIGAQGGDAKKAFEAGTSFAIVGRTILNAEKQSLAAKHMKNALNEAIA
ncbi:MAG TPA: orotidine-5'-phosphate decarboxylase [Candidatus Norongarragalinales archaeon]|nr:orotidine-5'-phosphate decarboxylase [Candidatus Norongarragalinales archaeon]